MSFVSLEGHHALVTGGGRGIGRSCAAALSAAGATVTVLGRDRALLEETLACGEARAAVTADVTDEAAIALAIAEAAQRNGPVDILVANAGGTENGPFPANDPAMFRRMFELNVMGVVHCVRGVYDGMIARGFGRIIVIASMAGIKGYPYGTAYGTAKHAVVGFVRHLSVETATKGVTVNAICPAFTDTDLLRNLVAQIASKSHRSSEEVLSQFENKLPIGRALTPEEVAAAVIYLASPAAGAITGATLPIAGGET